MEAIGALKVANEQPKAALQLLLAAEQVTQQAQLQEAQITASTEQLRSAVEAHKGQAFDAFM